MGIIISMDASHNQTTNIDGNQDDVSADSRESAIDVEDGYQEMISPGSYGLLALFFGWLGVHDFAARYYKYGFLHLIMAVVALCVLPVNISSFLPPTLLFASWLWAIWEVVQFRKTFSIVRTQEVEKRDYVIKAMVTEFFTVVSIIVVAVAIYFVISSKNCYASGCAGAGWAVAITIGIGFIPFVVAMVLLIGELISYRKMPLGLKKNNTFKNHTTLMYCLGTILLLVTIALMITSWFR